LQLAPKRQPNVSSETVYPEDLPVSSVSFYELGFGTVAGVCAGVFIKKGAKALAFLLGGVFVLLQVRCVFI
jgi:FUN14 domain-containing protein 1